MLNKKIGIFVGIFFAGLIAVIPMRTYVIMFNIDPKTGFYYSGSSLVSAVNILLLAVTVLLMAPLIIRSYKKLEAVPRRRTSVGIISAVLALAFCVDAVAEFYLLASGPGGAGVFFNSMFAFAAAVFFIVFAVSNFKDGPIAFPIVSLLPVIWAIVHLMTAFMHYTTVVNISEYLFDMLKMVYVMIFFYYHARFTGRASNGNELKGMLAFGLPAVFFSMLSILPRYIALAFGRTVTINLPEDLLFVVLSIYISAILYVVFFTRSRDPGSYNVVDSKKSDGSQAG